MRYTNRRLLYFSYFTLLQLKHHRSLNYVCYSAKRYLGGRAGSHTVRKLITGAYQLLEWLTVVKQLTSYSMHVRVCVCVCVCVCFQRYGDYDGQFSGARPLLNLSSSSLLSSSSSSAAAAAGRGGIGQAGCLVGRRPARTCHHHHHPYYPRTPFDKRPRGRSRTSSLSGKTASSNTRHCKHLFSSPKFPIPFPLEQLIECEPCSKICRPKLSHKSVN